MGGRLGFGQELCRRPDYKGKYEKGVNSFKVAGGSVVISAPSQSSVQCLGSSSSSGLMRGPNQNLVTLTLTGCERDGVKCASTGEMPGIVVSQPMESYGYEEEGECFTTLAGKTMMTFSCSTTEFRLSAAAAGQLKATLKSRITSSEATFSETWARRNWNWKKHKPRPAIPRP